MERTGCVLRAGRTERERRKTKNRDHQPSFWVHFTTCWLPRPQNTAPRFLGPATRPPAATPEPETRMRQQPRPTPKMAHRPQNEPRDHTPTTGRPPGGQTRPKRHCLTNCHNEQQDPLTVRKREFAPIFGQTNRCKQRCAGLGAPKLGLSTNPSLCGAKSKRVLERVSKWGAAIFRTSPQARTTRFVPQHRFSTFRADTAEMPHFGHAECPNFALPHVFVVVAPRARRSHRMLKNAFACGCRGECA
jgi:hypothetical protein